MATIVLPRSLVALFPGAERGVALDADTVAGAIDSLDAQWPGMRDRLRDEIGLRPHINVFVDGDRATLEEPLTAGSFVHIIPAVSGG
jgi:molybdopterin converting factor small subunit